MDDYNPYKIDEENKLIAEFLGYYQEDDRETWWYQSGNSITVKVSTTRDLKYHTKWDGWLMEAVEKIESINDPHHGYFGVFISGNSCTIQGTNFRSNKMFDPPIYFDNVVLSDKKISTYRAIINFIKWYNQR